MVEVQLVKEILYCAWCTRIPTGTRKEGVFYSSKICEKHLEELNKKNYMNKGFYNKKPKTV